MRSSVSRKWLGLAAVLVWTGAAVARQDSGGFSRVKDGEDGTSTRLEMGVREFSPKSGEGPKVYLAAAVHIAEGDFYKQLQEFLDAQDVVLFEGVKPEGAGAAEHDQVAQTDENRAAATKRRVRFVAMAVEHYRVDKGHLPESVEELGKDSEGRIGALLKGAMSDGWGRALVYRVDGEKKDAFDVVSLGSDGREGGEGAAGDIRYSDQKPLSKSEKGDRSEGIQTKLAEATGLVFQLSAMDNNKPNWRNSDLSIDQVQSRLEKAGADGGMLFKMLDGSSLFSKVGSMLLGFVGSTPEGKAMLRVMLIEMLGHADVLIQQAPGGIGKLMDVILEDRNQVVLGDLKRIVETEKGVKSVAIIYGAGHLPGIQRGILAMGYQPTGDKWFTAMRVSAKEAGLSDGQFKATREMVGKMVEAQAKKAK